MTEEENGRLARIETKLDYAIDSVKTICGIVYDPQSGTIAHEQRIKAIEGRSKAIIGISTSILLVVLAVGIKVIFGVGG
jgi:hypothetical protein